MGLGNTFQTVEKSLSDGANIPKLFNEICLDPVIIIVIDSYFATLLSSAA